MNNCFNCKFKRVVTYPVYCFDYPFCEEQLARIINEYKECPKFKASLIFKLFGDRTPRRNTEPLVGGCEPEELPKQPKKQT